MKSILIVALALASVSAFAAHASDYKPISGSCTPGGQEPGLCSCDLVSTVDGTSTLHSDTIQCTTLSCTDFQNADDCGGLNSATCLLSNRYYTGICVVDGVTYDASVTNAQQACQAVQTELNTPNSFGHDYCMDTSLRSGWNLISAQ